MRQKKVFPLESFAADGLASCSHECLALQTKCAWSAVASSFGLCILPEFDGTLLMAGPVCRHLMGYAGQPMSAAACHNCSIAEFVPSPPVSPCLAQIVLSFHPAHVFLTGSSATAANVDQGACVKKMDWPSAAPLDGPLIPGPGARSTLQHTRSVTPSHPLCTVRLSRFCSHCLAVTRCPTRAWRRK